MYITGMKIRIRKTTQVLSKSEEERVVAGIPIFGEAVLQAASRQSVRQDTTIMELIAGC